MGFDHNLCSAEEPSRLAVAHVLLARAHLVQLTVWLTVFVVDRNRVVNCLKTVVYAGKQDTY